MTDNDRLTELINRIRSGDGAAAEELVERYGAEVKAAMRHTLNRRNRLGRLLAPSDILQSVLLLLLRGGTAEPSGVENGLAYITRMAHNRIIHHARKFGTLMRDRKREVGGLEAAGGVADPSPSPSGVLNGKEELEALLKALPRSQREIAVARMADKTWVEIAKVTGEQPGTIQKRFLRTLNLAVKLLGGVADDAHPQSTG